MPPLRSLGFYPPAYTILCSSRPLRRFGAYLGVDATDFSTPSMAIQLPLMLGGRELAPVGVVGHPERMFVGFQSCSR